MDFAYRKCGVVGPLNGTLSRQQVRNILGGRFDEFKKTTASLNTTDAFDLHCLHVYYDVNDLVKGVEFFRGSTFSWKGQLLVGEVSSKALNLFRREEMQPDVDDDGFDMEELGMSVYLSDIEEGECAIVKAIYVSFCLKGR